MSPEPSLYLNAATVQACLSDKDIFEIVSQALREVDSPHVVRGPKSGFGLDIGDDHLHMGSVSGCILSRSAAGIKWFTVADRNPSRNLPRVPATILVCNAETGELEGILDATQLTSERTAAAAVAAVAACSRRPLKSVAVIGAGAIGRSLVKFLATTQPVERIVVASRNEASAQLACDIGASLRPDLSLHATSDVRTAVEGVDVVITATGVTEDSDIVRLEWLREDAVVCSLGSRREVDLEVLAQALIIVDDIDGVVLRRSDFREGGVGWNRIAADVGALMSGKYRLPAETGRVHLILAGLGVLDVALGSCAISNARRAGLGVRLEPDEA